MYEYIERIKRKGAGEGRRGRGEEKRMKEEKIAEREREREGARNRGGIQQPRYFGKLQRRQRSQFENQCHPLRLQTGDMV